MTPQISPEPSAESSPRSRRLGLAAFAIILLASTLALPFWTAASMFRTDQEVTIGAGEPVDEDLYVVADTFTLDGRADRDVFVAARVITINGRIIGSLNAAGGDIDLLGTVGRSVRVLSGSTTITGDVTGDLMIFGGTTVVEPGAEITGDIHVYGGTLDMRGTVRGDISGSVNSVTVSGNVGGDVRATVDRLAVKQDATVDGSLVYTSRSTASIDGDASVAGAIDRQSVAPWGTGSGIQAKFFSPLVRMVWLLATGALIIAVAPRLSSALNRNLRRPLQAALVGVLGLVLIPIVAVVLMVTVIGLPASILLMVGYVVALYLSQYVVGQRIGSLILPRRWNDGSRGYLLLSMTIGVILLSAVRFVPVPFLSTAMNAIVAVLGLGATVLLVRQLRPRYSWAA
jgi:cytoskeletal protein CcmA (bactofilin family)